MRFLVLALVLGVAACASSEPRIASSTTDAVTVVYPSSTQSTADRRAAEECSRYAKRAKLRNIRDDSDGWKMAIYDCAT